MSIFEIKMPKLGESITEGTITSWSAKVGDTIKEDDILLEVNTAKVSAEIPSPVSGKIVQIFFQTGDVVPIGKVIATVDTDGNGTDNTTEAAPPEKTETSVPEPTATTTAAPASIPVTAQAAKSETERWYSPIVLQIAQEAKISNEELAHIKGTGYQGRLSKKDINEYIGQKKKVYLLQLLLPEQKQKSRYLPRRLPLLNIHLPLIMRKTRYALWTTCAV